MSVCQTHHPAKMSILNASCQSRTKLLTTRAASTYPYKIVVLRPRRQAVALISSPSPIPFYLVEFFERKQGLIGSKTYSRFYVAARPQHPRYFNFLMKLSLHDDNACPSDLWQCLLCRSWSSPAFTAKVGRLIQIPVLSKLIRVKPDTSQVEFEYLCIDRLLFPPLVSLLVDPTYQTQDTTRLNYRHSAGITTIPDC